MQTFMQEHVAPYYLYIKFVHVCAVTLWAWSTSVAFYWFVRQAHLDWRRNRSDAELRRRKDWTLEQFDRGASIEHIAFGVAIVTGLMMFFAAGWGLDRRWLLWKLAIVVLIFIPMEILDIWLSHMGGNKEKTRLAGNPDRYESLVRFHWQFFRVASPLVAVFIPVLLFLAIVKP
ncbi:MAG: hypothetical protein KIT79_05940 [Deltaproteobacteria bacterium]|nr:hypothetical protein [Deltaproteobacteria bacterium]